MESAISTRHAPGSIRLAALRGRPLKGWAVIGLALLCVGALVGYFAFPTYPTYDSFYALLWGRDLLHLHLPDFRVYRGPTEHPLAIVFGALCSIFGDGGARLMVLGSIASFVAAVVGLYRLGRLCFGPVVGVLAALLLLSRFFVENLAAQGYLDISYVALIVWAIVLEVERPRRGAARVPRARRGGPAAPGRLGAERGLLAVVLARGEQPHAPAQPRPGGERPGDLGDLRRDRHGQPLLLADRHRGARPGTRTHPGHLGGRVLAVDVHRTHRQAPGDARRAGRDPARDLDGAAARARPAGLDRPAVPGVPGRGRRRRLGDRPLPARRGDRAAAVLRRLPRRLGDARTGFVDAACLDRRRRGADRLRGERGGDDREPLEPAQHARLPRGIPHRPGRGAPRPAGGGRDPALQAASRSPTTS